jgi:hypothetical protein
MPKSLSDIAKENKAKKQKRRSTQTDSSTLVPSSSTLVPSSSTLPTSSKVVVVEGLKVAIPDKFDLTTVQGKLPKFDASKYEITDASNPPETLPQISEADYQKASEKYASSKRVLSLEQQAAQVVGEQYKVLGARFKAFGEGVKAATEAEKTEGLIIDYSIQKENNSQKSETLNVATYQTANAQRLTTYKNQVSDEQLEEIRLKAEELKLKNKNTRDKLTDSGWTDSPKQIEH